jgi:hypothetical protein
MFSFILTSLSFLDFARDGLEKDHSSVRLILYFPPLAG